MHVVDIIQHWQYGLQYDAHELLLGILNSKSAVLAGIKDITQFEILAEGKEIEINNSLNCTCFVVTCSECQQCFQTVSQCSHLDVPVYPHQVNII